MSEFGYAGGGQAPHEEGSTREHFKQLEEDIHHEREADRFARAHPKRPWWKFWGKRRG